MPICKALGFSTIAFIASSSSGWAQDNSLFDEPAVKEAMKEIESALNTRFIESNVPGMAVAIVYDQKVVWTKGYGFTSLNAKTPVKQNTIFRIGSITKLFTATMLMQLRDEGRFHLDRSVEDFIPVKIDNPFEDPRPVTFRQLVSHTSGFPPEGGNYWKSMKIPTIDQLYADNPIIHLETPPLSSMSYSNFGVSVLGDALARIAGDTYERYVRNRIFEPLEMKDTAFSRVKLQARMIATGHAATNVANTPVDPIDLNALTPAGQAYSSAADMAKFISLQFRTGAAGGSQILGGTSLREMRQPVFLFPGLDDPSPIGFAIGIGWFMREIDGYPAIGHGGGIPGYASDITVVPAFKIGIVNLTNGGIGPNSDPTSLNKKILEQIIPALAKTIKDRRLKNALFDPSWEKYLGDYDMAGVAILSAIKQGDYMAFVHPLDKPGAAGILVPTENDNIFTLEGGVASGETVRFEMNDAGIVTGLEIVGIFARKL